MREIKFRMYNPKSKSYLYDVENVFECLMQQIVHDKTMPTRGFKVPYDHKKRWTCLTTISRSFNECRKFCINCK